MLLKSTDLVVFPVWNQTGIDFLDMENNLCLENWCVCLDSFRYFIAVLGTRGKHPISRNSFAIIETAEQHIFEVRQCPV